MWAQVKSISNNVQQLGLKARNTASQIVAEVLESAEELSNQAQQWEEDGEEGGGQPRSDSQGAVKAVARPASARLEALKARLDAERKRTGEGKPVAGDRSGDVSSSIESRTQMPVRAPTRVSPRQNGVAGIHGSSDQSPSSGPSSNRSTASTAVEAMHSVPSHVAAAPVRIATTGIPFGQGRGTAAKAPTPPAARPISPPRQPPVTAHHAQDGHVGGEGGETAAAWRENTTFEVGGPAVGPDSDVAHLRDQLKRLKQQMLSSARAAEEEQESIREEHAARVAALEGEAATLRSHLADAEIRLERDAAAVPSLEERLAEAELLLSKSREEANALRANLEAASQEASGQEDVHAALAQSQGLLREREAEAFALREQLEGHEHQAERGRMAIEAELAKSEQMLRESQAEAASLLEQLDGARQEAEGGRGDIEVAMAENLRLLRESQAEADALRGELASARQEAEGVAGGTQGLPLAAAVKRMQAQLDAERAAHAVTKGDMASLNHRVHNAEEEAERAAAAVPERDAFWKAELARQQTHVADLERRLEMAEEKASSAADRPHDIEVIVDELRARASRLELRCEAAEADLQDEQSRAAEAFATAERLAAELADAEARALSQQETIKAAWEAQEAAETARLSLEADWRARLEAAELSATQRLSDIEEELTRQIDAQHATTEESVKLRARLGELDGELAQAADRDIELRQALESEQKRCQEAEARCQALANGEATASLHMQETAQRQAARIECLEEEINRLRQSEAASAAEVEHRAAAAESASVAAAEARRAAAEAATALSSLQAELDGVRHESQRLQVELEQARAQALSEGEASASSQVAELTQRLADKSAALEEAEQERERAKVQLARLKQAMVSEQEDEEDKIRWRVEAEVRLAVEEMRGEVEGRSAELDDLRAAAAAAEARCQQAVATLAEWETAVAARDEEIRNLQAALGELTYESEAAERLRSEVRALKAAERAARDEAAAAKAGRELAENEARSAAQQLARVRHGDADQQERERRLQEEGAMLRRALAESMKRINLLNSDTSAMVDRRIVVKLLVTFFERGHSQEVLALMSRMLGFSEDEKRRVGIGVPRKGVLGTVASVPFALVRGTVNAVRGAASPTAAEGPDSLADSWIDFLIQQAEAADVADAQNRQNAQHAGHATSPAAAGPLTDLRLQRSLSSEGATTPRTPIFGPPR